jgi:hypothetical protein
MIQSSGSSAPYTFENLPSGQYQLFALKDVNGNGQLDNGDYMGIYNCTTLAGCQPTAVTTPAQGIDVQLLVISGSGGGGGGGNGGSIILPTDLPHWFMQYHGIQGFKKR